MNDGASSEARERFFRLLFGNATGYLCISTIDLKRNFDDQFYKYPDELNAALDDISRKVADFNIYFCPQLLLTKRRVKEQIDKVSCLWADLDACDPDLMLVPPSIVLETSQERFQALWSLDRPVDGVDAEDMSRRIAYKHAKQGADRSGWDLTQLLRVPGTVNLKYEDFTEVKIIELKSLLYRLKDFEELYPQVVEFAFEEFPFPEEFPTESGADILNRYRMQLNPRIWELFNTEPELDWSKDFWQLQLLLHELGLTLAEVFVVARDSACNKYARDGKSPKLLWKEICRSFNKNEHNNRIILGSNSLERPLLSDQEVKDIEDNPSFIERYIEWARGLGDAAWQYHQAGGFICLSSIMCGGVVLPTSFGAVVPNLWFMILADTTLTRKSTAMDIAIDLVTEIDPDMVMATDGSIEGMLTGLSTRPGRPSIFLRDEFTGLLEAITKKDYLAGMAELLTKMYDGKMQKRVLRKETVEVRDPRLIVFAGGIKNKMMQLLTTEHVSSGFVPRFVFITAESDITRLKPLGPPTERGMGNRDAIKNELQDMYSHYATPVLLSVNGQVVQQQVHKLIQAELTDDAWVRYNQAESEMLKVGMESERPEIMTPTYDRLSKSALKAAVLLAASRQRDVRVVVEESDVCRALYYMSAWRDYVKEIVNGVGQGAEERRIETLYNAIKKKDGITRSKIMQNYHVGAKEMTAVLETLEQRGMVYRTKAGKTEQLYARRTDE